MKTRNILIYIILLVLIPAAVVSGMTFFSNKSYYIFALAVAVLSLAAVFLSLERKKSDSKKLVIISVMTALSIVSRMIFEFAPHFKPVTAFVIITGLYLGKEAGFLCGAFSALISNFVFGQGPWTPFQMLAWGIIGLISALLSRFILGRLSLICLLGAVSGIVYSFLMDIYTVLWIDPHFSFSRYIAALTTAIPTTASYVVSNVLFLLVLAKPIGKKINRVKEKYGID